MRQSLLALMLVAVALPGCGTWSRLTGKDQEAQEQALLLEQMQQKCQRYADSYAGQVLETVGSMKSQASDPHAYHRLLAWQISQLNAAYTIATGPSPILCQLDFVVLATLSRMVVEDSPTALAGGPTSPALAMYRALEQEAWANAATTLTPAQLEELRGLIATWREKNPKVVLVGFVHFAEFAESAGGSPEARKKPGSLFGLIGLDPLADLDPAVRQIEQSRLLAERAIFYMQRVPYLMDLQTERIVSQATLSPQVERANASLERASLAMADYARIGDSLPDAFAQEREATIRQVSDELLAQQAELRGLLAELQTTLAAGSDTAVAVDAAVKSLDRLVARFPGREPGSEAAAGRRFDITEYSAAAQEFARTARELNQLIETLGREGLPVANAVADGVEAGEGLVDYLFGRALLLGLLLIASGLAAALAYRALAPRMGR
jgi:DNA-binding GntR family transcriptional regulator